MLNPFFPQLPPNVQRILFVCTGNLCRSAFAEAFFRALLAQEGLSVKVLSAGTQAMPGRQPPPILLRLALKKGLELNDHRSRRISPEILQEACIIFVMGNQHRQNILAMAPGIEEKIFLLSQFYAYPQILPRDSEIPDPIGREVFFYENVHEILENCCEQVLESLKTPKSLTLRNSPTWVERLIG